jgi:cytochrome c
MIRLAPIILIIAALASLRAAGALTLLQQRGYALVERMCARCHAVDRTGESPRAGAPPFRTLDRRLDLDSLAGRLREGLASSHPDMPMFRFKRDDAKAVVAYLRAIQGP